MKFAVTVIRFADGSFKTLLGAESGAQEHIENLKALANTYGAGKARVCVLFSNGTKKQCALNIEEGDLSKKATRKPKTD